MKKLMLGLVMITGLTITLLATTGKVVANPVTPSNPGLESGLWVGPGPQGSGTQDSLLQEKMVAAFALKMNMTVEEVQTRLDDGETMSSIAISKGYTVEQFTAIFNEIHTQVMDQAVKDGVLPRFQNNPAYQPGSGSMSANRGGMRGGGRGK